LTNSSRYHSVDNISFIKELFRLLRCLDQIFKNLIIIFSV
jgi:hypothetical protein